MSENNNTVFLCKFDGCEKAYHTSEGRSKHYRNRHKDVYQKTIKLRSSHPRYHCPYCESPYTTYNSFKSHKSLSKYANMKLLKFMRRDVRSLN